MVDGRWWRHHIYLARFKVTVKNGNEIDLDVLPRSKVNHFQLDRLVVEIVHYLADFRVDFS